MLTYHGKILTKKGQDSVFDIPKGSFFGAELCDLFGLYILDILKNIYKSNKIGLNRDDGLAIIKYKKTRILKILKKKKKQTIKIIKDIGFSITIVVWMTKCNYLDITSDHRSTNCGPRTRLFFECNVAHEKILRPACMLMWAAEQKYILSWYFSVNLFYLI